MVVTDFTLRFDLSRIEVRLCERNSSAQTTRI